MTFSEIVEAIKNRLNLRSQDATDRIGITVNDRYKRITSSIGLNVTRRTTVQTTVTLGVSTVIFSGIEKIISVQSRTTTPSRTLTELTIDELRMKSPVTATTVTSYAILSMGANTVTIEIDCVPQTAFTLYADGHANLSTLSGTQTPNFPESFHDIIMHGALADEYRKIEKLNFASDSEALYERRLSDLRMWIAKSNYLDIYQTKTSGKSSVSSGAGGSSGSGSSGSTSYTQTGLITFDRVGQPLGLRFPFTVAAGSEPVPNLTIAEAGLSLTDATTNNVTNLAHGFVPKSVTDATKFLNSAATPTWAQVKDTDLSLIDTTTNNVSTAKHGFVPKLPNNALTFLSGTGTYISPFTALLAQDLLFVDGLYDIGNFYANRPRNIYASGGMILDGSLAVAGGSTFTASVGIDGFLVPRNLVDISYATAGQIKFPAAQNASADANTLDDYEEGSWTPILGGSTGTGTQTYSIQVGRYVKTGKMVWVQWYVQLSSLGVVSGNAELQGLPFTSENTTNLYTTASVSWSSFVGALGYLTLQYPPNSTSAALVGSAGPVTSLVVLNTGNFNNTSGLMGSMTYRAA